jgi:hypothetical protein
MQFSRHLPKIFQPASANIQLWVGAWHKGISSNHAKIIAIDG